MDMLAVKDVYAHGDRTVQLIVDDAGRALGTGIANLVGALNIHRVVIAASLGQLGQPLLDIVHTEMRRRALAAVVRETHVLWWRAAQVNRSASSSTTQSGFSPP